MKTKTINVRGTGKKVPDSMIFKIAHVRDSEI